MSASKLDVLWSPVHHDKFVIWGSDITLYEVARLKDIEKKCTFTQISSTRGATVVASQSGSTVRCLDISFIAEHPDPLLALGHTNGRVSLASLKQTYDPLGLVGREFVPRHPRVCNSVSWNHVETNLLASAMEKHRSDHCILLWDVNRLSLPHEDNIENASTSNPERETVRPIAEMGLSETAHSVSWTNDFNRTLLASMNLKYIKIFDMRDLTNKAVSVASTRHCFDVCADPFSSWQLASRGDSVLCVWDARALQRPLLTLPQPRPVARVLWCPTRRNLLLSLQKDSNTIRLHDIQQTDYSKSAEAADSLAGTQGEAELEAEAEAEEPRALHALERGVSLGAAPLAAAAWHPAHEARLLVVAATGEVKDYTVCERVTVNWGAGGGLVWSGGGPALRLLPDTFYERLRDVSYVMRQRARTDYGMKADLWENAELAQNDAVSNMWHFWALSKSLVEDGCIRGSPWKYPGIRTVLRPAGEARYRSEIVPSLLPDLPHRRVTVYRSAERMRALQLCGWGWGWENAGAGVERAEAEGTPCRAAAIAAFHLRVRTALEVLSRAAEPQLRVVALALAGLGDERLWRDALEAAAPALPDAYLRALVRFLAASQPAAAPAVAPGQPPPPPPPAPSPAAPGAAPGAPPAAPGEPDAVLAETAMRLEDRVAYACIFLPDARLQEWVRETCAELVARGDLAGVLLTGSSPEGAALLQRWVDATGDVQTAALVAARCFTAELQRAPPAAAWLDAYRALLDGWRLWWARCALDTWLAAGEAGGAGGAVPRQVCAVCTYCGKSVAAPPSHARPRPAFARLPPPVAKMKISSCPNCRKPLPRCSVCSLHLGTGAGGAGAGGAGCAAQFAAWFSWCVACRHGGHAHHLVEWFKEHTECPVSSCSCRCVALDPPDNSAADPPGAATPATPAAATADPGAARA